MVVVAGDAGSFSPLVASGLPTDAFYFGGFLPPKTGQRARALEALAEEEATLVFYEAPHRILETLEAVEATLGARPVVVARELTKIHEEFLRGTAEHVGREQHGTVTDYFSTGRRTELPHSVQLPS